MSDTDDLLCKAVEGDRSARSRLFARYRGWLVRTFRKRIPPRLQRRISVSDIVQSALLEADRRLEGYARRRPMPFYRWLRWLTRDRLLDAVKRHLRQRRNAERECPLEPPCGTPSRGLAADVADRFLGPEQAAELDERARMVHGAIGQLSREHREVLRLRHWEELKNCEIAAILGIPESTASQRYMDALSRLRVLCKDARGTGPGT